MCIRDSDWNRGDCHLGIILNVLGQDMTVIHAVELIAAEDEGVFEIVIEEVLQVLSHCVCSALILGGIGEGLFCCENFYETTSEMVELVALRNVAMQRRVIE